MTTPASDATMTILLYSDDVNTRERVKLAVGPRPVPGVPKVRWVECATGPAVIATLDRGGVGVCVLDGEATPVGGLGLCRQLKDEIYQCPPILVLIGRPQDAWLAAWSRADLVVPYPLDPVAVAEAVAALMRQRAAKMPVS
jgi:DNA-binding response OmpR family regulator